MSSFPDDFPPGAVQAFGDTTPASVLSIFNEVCRAADPGAECIHWTIPEGSSPNVRCKRMWIMRTDGINAVDVDLTRKRTTEAFRVNFQGVMEFFVDGRDILAKGIDPALAHRHPRTTKHGWEYLSVGESKILPAQRFWLWQSLTLFVTFRRLEWSFHVKRKVGMERAMNSRLPYWEVIRKR